MATRVLLAQTCMLLARTCALLARTRALLARTRTLLARTCVSTCKKSAHEFSESAQNGLANVGESGKSAQNGLANVGESDESRKYLSTRVLAKVHMIRYVILCTENIFYCIKQSSLH